jgi:hypothetical protein
MAAAPVKVHLESRVLDREYAQPFIREVRYADIIEFKAVDAEFTVTIHNKDDFLTDTSGNDPGELLQFTLDPVNNPTQQYKIAPGPLLVLHKDYDVFWVGQNMNSDKPGSSPPRIIVVPNSIA